MLMIEKKRVFIRLHMLPASYYHSNAVNGGLGRSEEFMQSYDQLKESMQRELKDFPNDFVRNLIADPNIMNAARLTIFPAATWKHVLHYGMKRFGMWDDSFDRLCYSDGDNCIEHPQAGFDYSLLVPVMKRFGGWLDFQLCNFTTSSVDNNGQTAIVHSVHAPEPATPEQRRFMEGVFEVFGVQ